MDLATLTLFLPACFALNMAPGPNNLLSVSNATRYGYRRACVAGVGRLLAFAGMIGLAAAELSVVLQTSEWLFYAIKIIGAAYLLYLAWQLWRANPEAEQPITDTPAGILALARQEFLVAARKPNDCRYDFA
jgi:threonine/homoserine/homoserine lactone efflux protein